MNKQELLNLKNQLLLMRDKIDETIDEINLKLNDDSGIDLVVSRINDAISKATEEDENFIEEDDFEDVSTCSNTTCRELIEFESLARIFEKI